MPKPHILYLSYDGMTDPLGYSQVISYLKGLTEKGYRFSLISFEKKERMEKMGGELADELKNYPIHWHPFTYHKSPPVLSTLYDIWLLKQKSLEIHRNDPVDLVHCRGYISALVGLGLKRKHRLKFLFDMRAFFADERRESGAWPVGHPLYGRVYNYFKKKEKGFLEESDGIISLTEKGKEVIQSWKHLQGDIAPISVIPCAADLSHFNSQNIDIKKAEAILQELGLEGRYVLLYVGSISRYLLEEMMLFFKLLKKNKPNAVFLFLTQEPQEKLRELATMQGIAPEDLKVTPVERNDMPTYMSLADLGIFFASKGMGKTIYSPVKMGEMMGMGLPTICNSGLGDSDSITKNYDAGIVVDDFEESTLLQAVKQLGELEFDHNRIIKGAQEVYALRKGVEGYDGAYQNVLD